MASRGINLFAEREGFEPSVPRKVQQFSRLPRSTTPASLLKNIKRGSRQAGTQRRNWETRFFYYVYLTATLRHCAAVFAFNHKKSNRKSRKNFHYSGTSLKTLREILQNFGNHKGAATYKNQVFALC
jgi:hypothetical protein